MKASSFTVHVFTAIKHVTSFLPPFVFYLSNLTLSSRSSHPRARVQNFPSQFPAKILLLFLLPSGQCPNPGHRSHASRVRAALVPAPRWPCGVCSVNISHRVCSFQCSSGGLWVQKAFSGLTLAQYKNIVQKGETWSCSAFTRASSASPASPYIRLKKKNLPTHSLLTPPQLNPPQSNPSLYYNRALFAWSIEHVRGATATEKWKSTR